MNVIHIMADGSECETITGTVIQLPEFYDVLSSIREKERATKDAELLQR